MQDEANFEKTHDLNELLELMVEKLGEFTGAERILIYLYDEYDKVLWSRAGKGVGLMEVEFGYGEGIPGKVIEELVTYNIGDVGKDRRFDKERDVVVDVPMRSVLAVPITDNHEKRIGVIQLVNKVGGDGFDEKEVRFVESMAAQAAIAIENTLLFTNLQAVRKREQELGEEIREQNKKLQKAYLDVEEKNKAIEETARRIGKIRNIAIGFVVVVVLGIGIYAVRTPGSGVGAAAEVEKVDILAEIAKGKKVEELPTYMVMTQSIDHTTVVPGILEPAVVYNVFAPFNGRIVKKSFNFGEKIKEGQELLVLNSEDINLEYRKSKIEEINTRQKYEEKLKWADSQPVLDEKEKVSKAKQKVLKSEGSLIKNKKLLELGAVAQKEYDNVVEQLEQDKSDLRRAELAYENKLKEADDKGIEAVKLAWDEALLKQERLRAKLDKAVVKSETYGVAIKPDTNANGGERREKPIQIGITVDDGTVVVAVADISRLKILGMVDERDISKVKEGQDVRIVGEGFQGIVLKGKVVYVSSEAKASGRKPFFEIRVETEKLTEAEMKAIRLGMSANLMIITYSNSDAIMVPFNVVKSDNEGTYVYRVGGEGKPEQVFIQTGMTTSSSVEVTHGIQSGDKLLILE